MTTRWHVRACPGLDAVVFIGALSGNGLQGEHYRQAVATMLPRFDEESIAALDRLTEVADFSGTLVGPNLTLLFSAGPAETLNDVILSAQQPDVRLRPGLEASPYWHISEWEWFRDETVPDVLTVLLALRDAGFDDYWEEQAAPVLDKRLDATLRYLRRFDIIPEQERVLGRRLASEIDILLLYFSKPYGIRITGQRFASHYSYPMEIQLRTAVHELLHPPFQRNSHVIFAPLVALREDPWMQSIVHNHNPAFGYNSFEELVDEDSTQALDQIIAERMGFAWGPGARWRTSDDGMHMLAAAIYHMLREDDYEETGGDFTVWLQSAIDRGMFTPAEVRRRAASIVGAEAVNKWDRAGAAPARNKD